MGFSLRKKKRTSVEKKNLAITESKIIKLSYLQTLAVANGLTNIEGLGLTTNANGPREIEASQINGGNDVSTINDKLNQNNAIAIPYLGGLSIVSNVINAFFGKKVSVSAKTTVSDSGWSVVKVWNQPQFDIIRYSVGIKELEVSQFNYEEISEMVSVPWSSPKEVLKVSLYVDQFIPSEFPPGNSYIKYYIKVEEQNSNWIQINPIGLPTIFNEDGTIVPRIVTFNTEKPINAKLEQSFVYSDNPVKTIRFRAVFSRPTSTVNTEVSADAYTPILKSYKLLMTPRGGL